ncbi:hypothetical protein [Agrococcus sp. Marseille-Q4369]|uniref:hypothetical protein n=1 Tax=Agrococcus sp. Marseille-Q4369 TaxID=2810513 RepID=UPI001B8B62DD|nr:hypothetical protein [Agrococcus sp. Marseille-Q4369]QUW18402.1 hypothetical protein JSQ78_11370 [Agrococcus sp. Marseille-Q4369]
MAGEMPQFEMPPPVAPRVGAVPLATPSPPAPEVRERAIEPDASAPVRASRAFLLKHVAAAALVGLAIGAGVPAALEAAERTAAGAAVESLRATALDYVDAIAEGDSRRASQMVPIRGLAYAAPPEVLRSARPIEVPEVEVVHIEGDRGTAEVHYRVRGVDVFRTLQAERVDGAWELRTSRIRFDDRVHVAGVDPVARTVDLSVGFMALDEPGREAFDVQVRITLDEHDRPERWECGEPGWFGTALEACG